MIQTFYNSLCSSFFFSPCNVEPFDLSFCLSPTLSFLSPSSSFFFLSPTLSFLSSSFSICLFLCLSQSLLLSHLIYSSLCVSRSIYLCLFVCFSIYIFLSPLSLLYLFQHQELYYLGYNLLMKAIVLSDSHSLFLSICLLNI